MCPRDPLQDSSSKGSFVDQLEAMVPQMRVFARRLCRNDDLADDIVQEACLKAWAARDRFIAGAPMRPWLFRIIRNAHIQHWRKAWRCAYLDPSDAEACLIAPDNPEWTSDFQAMQQALQHLPIKQREAIVAVLAVGFSYEEAGQLLGCSEGTIKSRVSRGREALAGLMEGATSRSDALEPPPDNTGKAA
nr:RNA polymerase sigma factor [Hyphomonas sp. 34-62-18]